METQTEYENQEIKYYINQLSTGDLNAFETLVNYGEQAIPTLLETLQLQSNDEDTVILILGVLGQQEASTIPIRDLLAFLENATLSDEIWSMIIAVLAQANPSDLIEYFNISKSFHVRIAITAALWGTGADEVLPVSDLIAALDDPQPIIRFSAAKALGIIGSQAVDAIPSLKRTCEDENLPIRNAAGLALQAIGFTEGTRTGDFPEFSPRASSVSFPSSGILLSTHRQPVYCRFVWIKRVLHWKCS
jgi:hypothetical protein